MVTRNKIAPLQFPPGGNISSPRRLYVSLMPNGFAGGRGYFSPPRRESRHPHKYVPKRETIVLNNFFQYLLSHLF